MEMRNKTKILFVLFVWLLAALIVGQTRSLRALPVLVAPIIVLGLAGLVLFTIWKVPSLKCWVFTIDIRTLLLLHVTRFVGVYFLILYGRGVLPYEMVKAGWGDIFAAATAMLVCLFPMKRRIS